ncbi:DUF1684 domain-containing protein [Runella sp. MFBS21]|uniref:DUF1684 domain-containing protein n=1 Tax=Runella sp. MFBS21 TaxID=3034018 RepID=UPI0023F71D93|nr:DUF1684 domain-containing protein [Runella sp. MFBS21]MDF7819968.1 DUF1684 domain-containing protein [Runella sp. MFBS21]
MKKYLTHVGALLLSVFLLAFTFDTSYEAEIKSWHQKRIDDLKKEEGWLNLAGLFWLQEGENTIGGDEKNSIVFPKEHSDAFIGKIFLKNGTVTFEAAPSASVALTDQPISKAEIFPYQGKPTVLKHKTLRWFIIQRGDKYAIRLRDLEGTYLKNFQGIDTYPISQEWRVKAKFIPTVGKKLSIIDITGRSYEQDSPGKFVFSINGKEYSLEAVGSKERPHFVFGDLTNRHGSYGGGRFLDAPAPDAEGYTYIDFNKAYNPPCAFTPYATCPLPTKENKLAVAITAGEKYHGDY